MFLAYTSIIGGPLRTLRIRTKCPKQQSTTVLCFSLVLPSRAMIHVPPDKSVEMFGWLTEKIVQDCPEDATYIELSEADRKTVTDENSQLFEKVKSPELTIAELKKITNQTDVNLSIALAHAFAHANDKMQPKFSKLGKPFISTGTFR